MFQKKCEVVSVIILPIIRLILLIDYPYSFKIILSLRYYDIKPKIIYYDKNNYKI